MAGEDAAARAALLQIGFLLEEVRGARLTRLQGLTNRVYKVEIAHEAFCLRIPGEGTATVIDRHAEEAIARAAASIAISPEVLYFGADGVMLTRFIEAAPLSAERFRADPGAVGRVARALSRLHREAPPFPRKFDAFAAARIYRDLLQNSGATLPPRIPELMRKAGEVELALAAHPVVSRPCHCDTTGANLLDTGERIWLIDWEYAGMNDPAWDLAYLSVQAGFEGAQDEALLAAYFGRPPTVPEASRMAVYKPPVQLLSALWALVQDCGGNRVADFPGYALATFRLCRDEMHSARFAEHLETVRRG